MPVSAVPVSRNEIRSGGWLSPEARRPNSKALIYVDSSIDLRRGRNDEVLIYSEESPHTLLGKITDGIDEPWGMYVDKNGTLYVANTHTNTVTAYPAGSLTPSTTWSRGLSSPFYPIVDSKGDLFVSNGNGKVVEYAHGGANPYRVLQTLGTDATGMDFDRQGNLYVAYGACQSSYSCSASIEEFAPGSTQGKSLGMALTEPQGLIVDKNDNIIVVEVSGETIDVFRPGAQTPSQVVHTPPLIQIAINGGETDVFGAQVIYGQHGVVVWTAYPFSPSSRMHTRFKTPTPTEIYGIALSNGQTFRAAQR